MATTGQSAGSSSSEGPAIENPHDLDSYLATMTVNLVTTKTYLSIQRDMPHSYKIFIVDGVDPAHVYSIRYLFDSADPSKAGTTENLSAAGMAARIRPETHNTFEISSFAAGSMMLAWKGMGRRLRSKRGPRSKRSSRSKRTSRSVGKYRRKSKTKTKRRKSRK